MVRSVHRILSLQLTVVENKTFKVKTLIKSATYFTHERSCKKIRLFFIHCEEGVYSKQHCLWNLSLTGNGKVSAQNTVIAVNCRWKQDIQGKDINKTRKLIYTWIMHWHFVYHSLWRVLILNSLPLKGSGTLVQISQSFFTLKDIQSKKTLIIYATYSTHECCKKIMRLWAFIVKRVFILSSIASETGYSLEMVQSVHRILSL